MFRKPTLGREPADRRVLVTQLSAETTLGPLARLNPRVAHRPVRAAVQSHHLYSPSGRHSSVVEQLFRKQQVLGSNPSVGSTLSRVKRPLWWGVRPLRTSPDPCPDPCGISADASVRSRAEHGIHLLRRSPPESLAGHPGKGRLLRSAPTRTPRRAITPRRCQERLWGAQRDGGAPIAWRRPKFGSGGCCPALA
jgi:hypothetical protein